MGFNLEIPLPPAEYEFLSKKQVGDTSEAASDLGGMFSGLPANCPMNDPLSTTKEVPRRWEWSAFSIGVHAATASISAGFPWQESPGRSGGMLGPRPS